MNKNLTFRNISNKSTKAFRGGTAQEQEQFELNLQLHAGVSNPYTFKITKNYKASADTKAAIPPYTEKSWTTPGTYTWTVPNGVTKVRVAVCGGGGGGTNTRSKLDKATSGGTSSVSINNSIKISASGGSRITGFNDYDGAYIYYNGNGGSPNPKNDGTGWSLNFNQISGTYGRGSKVNVFNYSTNYKYGGSGGYDTNYLEISNETILTISVGNKGSNYDNSGLAVDSTSGFVLIAYGEGIE